MAHAAPVSRASAFETETAEARAEARHATSAQAPQRLSVLGATGSIGTSTLDLVGRHPERFEIVALTAQCNAARLAELAVAHRAQLAVIGDPAHYDDLKSYLAGTGIRVAAGPDAVEAAALEPADCVMAAIVGAAGLKPTFAAARQGRRVALANKECLVSAGDIFLEHVRQSGAELLPVDSEHSGAFQSIGQTPAASIEKIVLTASGGPFRTLDKHALERVTPEQALKHPNWSMGAKVTIDSATLMNKGLELIEAYHLFPVEAHQLEAIVHPQSVVHCLVMLEDGSVMAQLSQPDMRTPIALALSWPERLPTPVSRLDLLALKTLSFEAPDLDRFPALGIATDALRRGGAAPAVLNAANEIAVAAFIDRRIGFLDIAHTVASCLENAETRGLLGGVETLDDVLAVDLEARNMARTLLPG
ncbi:1-deoxy-D-xylulose-5-phosphate reductoisomerase [Hyphomicrobium sp.]|uniref:1-deoxy-D-xylulose-5-phosphate reductoisomerase n=1 Tax=Hyphomicrobium sp. TaxID=82 RepID=UPI002C08C02A|nr:1-deoxy-D-xylulose-5-phosphate reductoisomerase [Hyphomicrobium sp.]HRN87209.1 1-deoxy-D-xylulose-5-phosphate reductoisomerase [Hyphomicrobium sp.]HRQ25831.1 1-deoxy-D-xylulose-5-phosphate reductoisomerase [Hyphomicrobium sp.]